MSAAYDTLDDIETKDADTIADVYELVIGAAMETDDLIGVVTTGHLEINQTQGGSWGAKPLTFKDHAEVWYMRCAPKGRAGKALEHGEVRQVSVLVRRHATSKDATVSNIKLWRKPTEEKLLGACKDLRQSNRGWTTLGPLGVPMQGIHLFERRSTNTSKFYAPNRTHCVLPAVATITHTRMDGSEQRRIEPLMTAHYVMAAAMLEIDFEDTPSPRRCQMGYTDVEWAEMSHRNSELFKSLCKARFEEPAMPAFTKLMVSCEDVCEQMSFIGYLDQRADPFYAGAMPDDMYRPSGMPLMIAAALSVALNPARWGLPPTCGDDAFAIKEAAFFIEATLPHVMAMSNGTPGTENVYCIDVVVNYALAQIKAVMPKLQSGQLDGKLGGVNARSVEEAMKSSMLYLLCTGTAVCVDLFGLRPNTTTFGGGEEGLYTSYGLAHLLTDPMLESRTQSAHAKRMGNTVPRWTNLRTSTRGKRQHALASVLVDVDQWLRTGKFKGVMLYPTAQASESARPEDMDPSAARAAAPAPAPAPTRSAKKVPKKQRGSGGGGESLLAEKGKLREVTQQSYATDAIRCMFKPGMRRDEVRVQIASKNLSGEAVSGASAIFSDIVQGMGQGVCAGMGDLFDVVTYLVAPTSTLECAHCTNTVNVVECVAFAGIFGTCSSCGRPRCLQCVSKDIRASSEPCQIPCPLSFINCQYCNQEEKSQHYIDQVRHAHALLAAAAPKH